MPPTAVQEIDLEQIPPPPPTTLRGSNHPNAKLDERTVRMIRAYKARGYSYRQIAEKFGISMGHAQRVVAGVAWAHVAQPK